MGVARLTSSQRTVLARGVRSIAADAAVAAGLAVLLLTGLLGTIAESDGWPVLVVLLLTVPLVVRWVRPLPVFGFVLLVSLASWWWGPVREPMMCAAYALYPVAVTASGRARQVTAVLIAASGFAVTLGVVLGATSELLRTQAQIAILGLVALGVSWALGRVVRERRLQEALAAAAETAVAVQGAVVAERLRVARELHDVVSRTISLMAVEAAVARHVADTHPEQVHEALRVIEVAGRDATAEMRQLLLALRGEDDDTAEDMLGDLVRTTAWAADAGVVVEVDVTSPERVPAAVRPAVREVVQEAVTNVVRHAAPTRCRVTVDAAGPAVWVAVVDDGPSPRRPGFVALPVPQRLGRGAGLGLRGMRERVTLHGGTVSAARCPSGGFSVTVTLPGHG